MIRIGYILGNCS